MDGILKLDLKVSALTDASYSPLSNSENNEQWSEIIHILNKSVRVKPRWVNLSVVLSIMKVHKYGVTLHLGHSGQTKLSRKENNRTPNCTELLIIWVRAVCSDIQAQQKCRCRCGKRSREQSTCDLESHRVYSLTEELTKWLSGSSVF